MRSVLLALLLFFCLPLTLLLFWGEMSVPPRTMLHPDQWLNVELWWAKMDGIGMMLLWPAVLLFAELDD